MKIRRVLGFLLAVGMVLSVASTARAQINISVIHSFQGTNANDGMSPVGTMATDGTWLYGATEAGGTNAPNSSYTGGGMLFKEKPDGTGYTNLHDFTNAGGDGMNPVCMPILSGSTLYGTAMYGGTPTNGSGGKGVLYSINTDGTGYQVLHEFIGSNYGDIPPIQDGKNPISSPTLVGGYLYGTTQQGCTDNYNQVTSPGIVYRISTNGTGYTILHSFIFDGTTGFRPNSAVVVNGSYVYGTTSAGTNNSTGQGVIYRMNLDGSGYTNLHLFVGQPTDGNAQNSISGDELTLIGTNLYGMTYSGGTSNNGTLFRIGLDGSGYTNLHSFAGGKTDGGNPRGSLTLVGANLLYGMTEAGGGSFGSGGTIFDFDITTGTYTDLYNFSDHRTGVYPWAPDSGLVLIGTNLAGTSFSGDFANSLDGTVFCFGISAIPEPGTVMLVALLGLGFVAFRRLRRWQT